MEKLLPPKLYFPPLDQSSYGSRDLETNFHNELEIHSYIPLSKHILWILSENGHYETWNVTKSKLMSKDILKTEDGLNRGKRQNCCFNYYNESSIIYLSESQGHVIVLDVINNVQYKDWDYTYLSIFDSYKFPTMQSQPENFRTSAIIPLHDQKQIIVHQQSYQCSYKNVITILCQGQKSHQLKWFNDLNYYNLIYFKSTILALPNVSTSLKGSPDQSEENQSYKYWPIEYTLEVTLLDFSSKQSPKTYKIDKIKKDIPFEDHIELEIHKWKDDSILLGVDLPENIFKIILFNIDSQKIIQSCSIRKDVQFKTVLNYVNPLQNMVIYKNREDSEELSQFFQMDFNVNKKYLFFNKKNPSDEEYIYIPINNEYFFKIHEFVVQDDDNLIIESELYSMSRNPIFYVLYMFQKDGISYVYSKNNFQDILEMLGVI